MRRLDTLRLRARSLQSELRRRLPEALSAVAGPPRPRNLDLRLGPVAGLDPDPLKIPTVTASQARDIVVSAVARWGPLPVRVWTGQGATESCWQLVTSSLRFAHRLDCPVTLVTDGHGLDAARALALVDGGLARGLLLVHDAEGIATACTALQALTAAADARGVPLDLTAWIVAGPHAPSELAAASTALSRSGAHDHAVIAPWRDEPGASLPEGLTTIPAALPALLATGRGDGEPGLTGGGRCPVAHHRVELSPDGELRACPHHAPLDSTELDSAWTRDQPHFAAVRSCSRRCLSPLLVPPS
jgi:hypothetical protein